MAGRFKRIKPTSFMAMAAQMWPKPDQPIMYGSVEIEMTKALDYISRYSEKHGVHVTVTHLVVASLARYLKKYPEANVKCEAGKFYQRQDIDIFVLVSGDRDFVPLMNQIRAAGKEVYAIGVAGCTSSELAVAVDEMFYYHQLLESEEDLAAEQKDVYRHCPRHVWMPDTPCPRKAWGRAWRSTRA